MGTPAPVRRVMVDPVKRVTIYRDHGGDCRLKGAPAHPGGAGHSGHRPAADRHIDITFGVPHKQFIRGEWLVSIAVLTG